MAKLKDLGVNNFNDRNCPPYEVKNEFPEFKALLCNALRVAGANYVEEQRIKELLITSNLVGYDDTTKLWLKATPSATRNNYNLPVAANFTLPQISCCYTRKLSYKPTPGGAFLIKGLPGDITYADIISEHTDVMEQCDIAIRQNLLATKSPCFMVIKDKNLRLTVEHAIQQQQAGMPVIVVDNNVSESIKGIPLNTPIIFSQIYEFRQKIRDALLNKLSVLTANVDKRERVQSAEVSATVGQCEDYIYMLIDNVNRQFESYGLNYRMELNSSLEELYTPEEGKEFI